MLTIILGPPGSGKTAHMLTRIRARARQGLPSVLLAPESASHEQERRLLAFCGNRASAFAGVTTFSKLTEDALRLAGLAPRTLDAGGRVLTMYRALRACGEGLRYYRADGRPELLHRLLALAEELKSAGVSPERFLAAAEGERMGDLALIYAHYCALCARGALDPADRLTRAMEALPQTALLRGAEVFVDGFDLLTGQKYDALGVILRQAEGVFFALPMGEDEQLYLEQTRTRARLHRLAASCGVPCTEQPLDPPAGGRPPALRYAAARLFDYRAPRAEDGEGLSLYAAADPAEECELAAALLRQEMLAGGRLRERAVVCGDLSEYGPLLERAFARYEVPLFLSTKEDILQKPALLGALGAVQALEDGLSPESVLDWLKTGLCPPEEDARFALEDYVLRWGIAGARWLRPFTLPTCGYGNPAPDEGARLAAVEGARAAVAALLAPLQEELRACRTGQDYADALSRHLERMGFEEALIARAARLRALGMAREAAEYAQLWDILSDALGQFAAATADEPMDRTDFLRLLRLMLGQYDVSSIPVSLDSVQAVTLERMALGPLRHLVLIGAREGLLPPDKPDNSLLTERDRIALEGAGIELTQSAEERAFQQQLAAVRAVAAPSERLSVLYPLRDGEGAECRPSYLVARLRALLPAAPQEAGELLPALRLTARRPALALAFAAAEEGERWGSLFERVAYARYRRSDGAMLDALRAYATGPRGPIADPALVRGLYGARLRLTASRLEQLSACRFAYFMQYGLRAKGRREAAVGPPEAGSYVHYVVEHAVRELCEGRASDPAEAAAAWAARYCEALPQNGTRRQQDQLARIAALAADVVSNAWAEIRAGSFAPHCFELGFGMGEDGMPPLVLGEGAHAFEVRGKIDRVDRWRSDGHDYLKVIDYKTGSKQFRLSDVLSGVNLQLFLYLLAIERADADHLRALGLSEPEAAAALYLPAKPAFAPCGPEEDEQARRAARDKTLRRIGLVLDDPAVLAALENREDFRFLPVERKRDGAFTARSDLATRAQFDRLLRQTEQQARKAAALVLSGDVEAMPYTDGQHSPCDWCDYRAACQFDPTLRRDRVRRLPRMSAAEVHAVLAWKEEASE